MRLDYSGAAGRFDAARLMQRLLAVYPGWLTGEGEARRCLLYVQTAADGSRALLDVPSGADAGEVGAVVRGLDALAVATSREAILADGADEAVITCADPAITRDAAVAYRVLLDGALYAGPASCPVADGRAALSLAVEVPGRYEIVLERAGAGAWETGRVTVMAEEVDDGTH